MRLYEILTEDVSPAASLKNIVDILSTELPGLYRTLGIMAEKYAKTYTPKRENGVYRDYSPEDFYKSVSFIMNGRRGAWYKDVFFNNMKSALYNFSKSLPGNLRSEMNSLLSDATVNGSFKVIEQDIIPLLNKIAISTKNDKLKSAVNTVTQSMKDYGAALSKAETIAADVNADVNSGYNEPKAKEKGSIGGQNAAVDAIIADVLSRIDKKAAGEIRNAIAKSDNKLMALQQELRRRDINL